MAYQLKLGRLNLITTDEAVVEALGDTVELVGSAVLRGERRARPQALSIPVHGDGETDTYAQGEKLRRQVRSMIDNPKLMAEAVYVQMAFDPDQNGWMMFGGGDLAYEDGGVSLADYKLALTEAYKLGAKRTHRSAKRISVADRRATTVPADIEQKLYSGIWTLVPGASIAHLPIGASDIVKASGPVALSTRSSDDGNIPFATGLTDGDVYSYEQDDGDVGKGDVVVLDRRGNLTPTAIANTALREAIAALSSRTMLSLPLHDDLLDDSANGNNAMAVNGAALATGAALVPGDPGAVSLDGSNDYLATGLRTRANLIKNPSAEVDLTGWAANAAATIARVPSGEAPDGGYVVEVTTPGANTYDGVRIQTVDTGSVAPGDQLAREVMVKAPAGLKITVGTSYFQAGGTYIGGVDFVVVTATGEWQRLVLATAPTVAPALASKAEIAVTIQSGAGAAVAAVFQVDCALLEKAVAPSPKFFPTVAQLASGEAGWSGTAHNSISQIGPFANGAKRTFVGVAVLDTNAGTNTLIGSDAAGSYVSLNQIAGGLNLRWDRDTSGGSAITWAGAIPALGVPFMWALVDDPVAETAALYINGTLVSQQALADDYPLIQSNMLIGARTSTFGSNWDGAQSDVAVLQGALSAAEIRALAAAMTDPQKVYGWEEVYGSNYPLSAADIPVLQNGVIRLRYEPARFGWALEELSDGTYTERGKIFPQIEAAAVDSFKWAKVVEWTPERAVIMARFAQAATSLTMDVYVILQRGWSGPRIETYLRGAPGTNQPGLLYAPNDVTDQYAISTVTFKRSSEGGWNGTTIGVSNVSSAFENWVALIPVGGGRRMHIAHQYNEGGFGSNNGTLVDVAAARTGYAGTVKGYEMRGQENIAPYWGGWEFRLSSNAAGNPTLREAETDRFASGTTSQVADGGSSGGQLVRDTQAASTNDTLRVTSATAGLSAATTYELWVRVKVQTAGATGSIRGGYSGLPFPTVTFTNATYAWVRIAYGLPGAAVTWAIQAWRSAGTGAVDLDMIAFVPSLLATADGPADVGRQSLSDVRVYNELVGR